MRRVLGGILFFVLLSAVPAFAAATQFTISFTTKVGSPTPSGSFSYDPALVNSFSNFLVEWDGLLFNFTNAANNAGAAQILGHPFCANGLSGAAATFYLLTQCPSSGAFGETAGWSVTITSSSSTFGFGESDLGGANVFNLSVANGINTPTVVPASARGVYTSSALPQQIYITDIQNGRVRAVNSSGVITTVAGNGGWGYNGDQEQAIQASLNNPQGVAVDSSGDIYIADTNNGRVREVNTGGSIVTVWGNGLPSQVPNPGLARPVSVAVDQFGNVYVADSYRVRMLTTSAGRPVIITVAGTGSAGSGGDGGLAINAQLNGPRGIALDSLGNLYIADAYNNRIREVNTSGIITTVAGNGTAGYSGDGGAATSAELSNPTGVAVDGSGNIYIADYTNSRIRMVTASTGIITTVAGSGFPGFSGDGGAATAGRLNYPSGVAVDNSGNIYIADSYNSRIREVTAASGIITTVAGTGPPGFSGDGGSATGAQLYFPTDVTVPNH